MLVVSWSVTRAAGNKHYLLFSSVDRDGTGQCCSDQEGFHIGLTCDAPVRAAIHFSIRRKKASPSTAIFSRPGSMRRQMAAARAMTFTSVVNDSITTSPL